MKTVFYFEDSYSQAAKLQGAIRARGMNPRGHAYLYDEESLLQVSDRLWDNGELVGVITDLYFPAGSACDCMDKGDPAPLGLVVLMHCQSKGIPCVIVTAGYHHGSKYNQVHCALRALRLQKRLVDCPEAGDGESQNKNWEEGLNRLLKLAEEMGVVQQHERGS